MRAIDRDLIRAGHYGQRPGVPHSKAEHIAAPTKAANVKKVLANSEPSTHGTKRTSACALHMSAYDPKPDMLGYRTEATKCRASTGSPPLRGGERHQPNTKRSAPVWGGWGG